jgi:ribose 5-phosphate isomerase B
MKIALGSDHRGYKYKEKIKDMLKKRGIEYFDFGTYSTDSCDYPDFAKEVAERVSRKEFERGILICATGIGMSISANKFKNIRATLCLNKEMAEFSRRHNNSNILVLSGMFTPQQDLEEILDIWLKTEFEGGRHERRINKIKELE